MLARIGKKLLVFGISILITPGSKSVIAGIGIDLVECDRFLDWSAFKKQRIFTKKELEYADNDNANSEKHLANFWAAREACLKALGTGFRQGIFWPDLIITHTPAGKPELRLRGNAAEHLKKLGAGQNCRLHVTMTDDFPWAQAFVIIETLS